MSIGDDEHGNIASSQRALRKKGRKEAEQRIQQGPAPKQHSRAKKTMNILTVSALSNNTISSVYEGFHIQLYILIISLILLGLIFSNFLLDSDSKNCHQSNIGKSIGSVCVYDIGIEYNSSKGGFLFDKILELYNTTFRLVNELMPLGMQFSEPLI